MLFCSFDFIHFFFKIEGRFTGAEVEAGFEYKSGKLKSKPRALSSMRQLSRARGDRQKSEIDWDQQLRKNEGSVPPM